MKKREKLVLKPSNNSICGKSYNLLNIKLLNSCNGKCEFCIAAGTPFMKSADAQKFIDTANSMTKFSKVDVLGGEPTLYPDLVKVLKGIRPYKKDIGIKIIESIPSPAIVEAIARIPNFFSPCPFILTSTLALASAPHK